MQDFPGGSDCKESAYNAGGPGSIPELGRSFGEGNGYPPVFLPGEFHGQRSLVGYSPWGHQESDMTEWLSFKEDKNWVDFWRELLCFWKNKRDSQWEVCPGKGAL